MKFAKLVIITLIILTILLLTVVHILVVTAPARVSPARSDAVLVLGYALVDGNKPDNWLELRLERSLQLYNQGYSNYIIVSGGQGPTDQIPVAEAMKIWLVDRGIPKEKVLVEDKAFTTFENIKFSKQIIDISGLSSVIIVTSDFHLFRSMIIAKDYLKNVSGAAAPSTQFLKRTGSYLREDIAVIKYFIFKS